MPLYRFAFLFVLPMVLCLSLAKDVHFGPEHWTANNHARVFDGYADEGWLTRDAGGKSPHDQQWVWMDFTAALSGIETDDRIIQASLTWPGVRENWADAAPGLVYRLFPVQDGNFGRDQIYAAGATTTREAGDVVAYNQANVGYGEVRDLDMAFQAKAMDITELIRGWHNGSIPGNREAVLLWDKQAVEGQILQAFWGNQLSATAGTGPSIEITTMKPEPFTPEVIGPLPVSYNPKVFGNSPCRRRPEFIRASISTPRIFRRSATVCYTPPSDRRR